LGFPVLEIQGIKLNQRFSLIGLKSHRSTQTLRALVANQGKQVRNFPNTFGTVKQTDKHHVRRWAARTTPNETCYFKPKKIAQKKWPTLKNNYLASWQVIWGF